MTIHGDLYYEGKEFETRLKNKKPGELSDELRVSLGMPTGLVRMYFHCILCEYLCMLEFFTEQTLVSSTMAYRHATIWPPSVLS